MQTSGLPPEHLELVLQLEEMERYFLQPDNLFSPKAIAQGLTCLAHDFVQIGLEERGHALLLKADKIFPGYHSFQMLKDMEDDENFAKLVRSLSAELILVALSTVRDSK